VLDENTTNKEDLLTMNEDLDIVNKILGHRLKSSDIQRILSQLNNRDQATFQTQMSDILRKTSALLEVSRRVSESLSLDLLLPRMVSLISEFLLAERSTIFLKDNLTGELYSRVAQGNLTFEIRIPSNKGIAGHVYLTGKPLIINNPYADPRFNSDVDKKSGYRTRNMICAPILHRHEPIGVIQVLNRTDVSGLKLREDSGFEDADLVLLESIASHAAVGFENARLHDQVTRAQEHAGKLLDVTTAISQELQLKPLLIKIMSALTNFLDADRSTLFLYDEKTDELWSQVAQGSAEIRFPAHLGLAGSVFKSGEKLNIPDAYADERFNRGFDKKSGYKTNTILCMPVMTKAGRSLGVIQVINKKGGPFDEQDERALRAFCAQASIAIENAQLFEEVVQVKNYNESILQSMSNSVITLDADGCLVKANRAALSLFGGETSLDDWTDKSVDQLFGSQNDWVSESIEKVNIEGEQVIAMDMDLVLPLGSEKNDDNASVNMATVPLSDAKGGQIGCMLVMEDISKEKRLRGTMARYMPKEVADRLLEGEGEALGGTLQMASVLFSDIRSFTTISEKLGAQETVKMLNDYFGIMVDLICDNHGILDKFIGDAIMAVFGAPFPGPEDADNAVKTAIQMMQALHPFNARRVVDGKDAVLIGIGVNTGEVLSGNIGSAKRMDYTVIGDGVNLSARLEGATKPYGTPILISEFTVNALHESYRIREIDRIRVKGKTLPVAVFEVMDHLVGHFAHLDDVADCYLQGLSMYKKREWRKALDHFEAAIGINRDASVSRLYVDRCNYFIENPPLADWDGVWTMKSK
jgi:adenylate cyclase